MYAICIECSHARGMGHLYRALNMVDYLRCRQERYVVLTNHDALVVAMLEKQIIPFEIVQLTDWTSDWESELINKHRIDIWINDRLNTDMPHAWNVKKNGVRLVTFDDRGSGSVLADFNVAAMSFDCVHDLAGKAILSGAEYLILNKEIDKYKKMRKKAERIIVSLGGSDTYGVTVKVAKGLKKQNIEASIILGPGFKHRDELEKVVDDRFTVKESVPSLVAEFSDYDLAITGGGVTPFEANASGLPAMIIANELHEIPIGRYLAKRGCSLYAGYHTDIDDLSGCLHQLPSIKEMSRLGMDLLDTMGVDRIFEEIRK